MVRKLPGIASIFWNFCKKEYVNLDYFLKRFRKFRIETSALVKMIFKKGETDFISVRSVWDHKWHFIIYLKNLLPFF